MTMTYDPLNEGIVDLDGIETRELQRRHAELERKVATLTNLVDKLQNELIKAGRYEGRDLSTTVEGIQYLLTRAGEVKGRQRGRR